MKKLLFSLPVLALTLFLAFCNKPNVQEEVNSLNGGNLTVADRGTCNIEIFADNLNELRVCGLKKSNKNACTDCGLNSFGVELINGYESFAGMTTPVTFSVTNLGMTTTYIRVQSGFSGTAFVAVTPGNCQTYTVDNFCNVF